MRVAMPNTCMPHGLDAFQRERARAQAKQAEQWFEKDCFESKAMREDRQLEKSLEAQARIDKLEKEVGGLYGANFEAIQLLRNQVDALKTRLEPDLTLEERLVELEATCARRDNDTRENCVAILNEHVAACNQYNIELSENLEKLQASFEATASRRAAEVSSSAGVLLDAKLRELDAATLRRELDLKEELTSGLAALGKQNKAIWESVGQIQVTCSMVEERLTETEGSLAEVESGTKQEWSGRKEEPPGECQRFRDELMDSISELRLGIAADVTRLVDQVASEISDLRIEFELATAAKQKECYHELSKDVRDAEASLRQEQERSLDAAICALEAKMAVEGAQSEDLAERLNQVEAVQGAVQGGADDQGLNHFLTNLSEQLNGALARTEFDAKNGVHFKAVRSAIDEALERLAARKARDEPEPEEKAVVSESETGRQRHEITPRPVIEHECSRRRYRSPAGLLEACEQLESAAAPERLQRTPSSAEDLPRADSGKRERRTKSRMRVSFVQ